MHSPCDPPEFDEQDWSKFDFSRWHLDGLTLDAAAAAFANLSQNFFQSEEWREHFQETLPEVQRQARAFFEDHSRQLREQRAAVAQNYDARVANAQQRSEDVRQAVEKTTAPPAVVANPETYSLAVRVTAKDPRLGLPGIVAQIADPRQGRPPLVQGITGRDGNAVLTVPPELAKELDKQDTALEVLHPSGKPLVKTPAAVCVRLNQTETKVVTIPDSPEIEPQKAAALAIRAELDANLRNLSERANVLIKDRDSRLEDIDCRIRNNDAIIATFKSEDGEPTPSPPSDPAQPSGPTPPRKPTKPEPGTPPRKPKKKQ